LNLSGASTVQLEGTGNNINLQASGASKAYLGSFSANDMRIDLSGASRAEVLTNGKLDVFLSGVSTLDYGGNPEMGTIDISGDSTLSHSTVSTDVTVDVARQIATNFVKNSSTFAFDGIQGSIKVVSTEPGWSSIFKSIAVNLGYQTRHPGHGDRAGEVLAQVITDHSAVILVNIEKGTVATAICDKTWDMVNEKNPPMSVTGTVISGGDTTPADGPVDAPRVFVYEIQRDDGTTVNVSYTSYPPSPVGDANRNKITLEIAGGTINIGDRMEALGRINKETNTIVVADQGDYIRSWSTQ
jgi:hypothetical protein